jgi:hypothetical protein
VQALVVFVALALVPVGVTVAAPPACAAAAHHAALIVDTGSGPARQFCVGFSEETITGKDVLDRAGVDPVYRSYGANGVAVCSLLGVGRDADHCLESGNNWAYFRATGGATAFSYSNVGVSSATVHDGDVEGWKWEAAPMPPPFAPASQVCPASSPSPSPPETAPAGRVTNSTPGTTAGTATAATAAVPSTTASGGGAPAAATTASDPSVSTSTSSTSAGGRGQVAARRTSKADGGGSPWSLAVFGVFLAGLLGWLVWARRARRRRAT